MYLSPENFEFAYGHDAATILRGIENKIESFIERFVAEFFRTAQSVPETKIILDRLSPEELESLRARQCQHLRLLLTPDLDYPNHREAAIRIGRTNGLAGMEMLWLIEGYGIYQQDLVQMLTDGGAANQPGPMIHRIISRRLFRDLEAQSIGFRQLETELSQALSTIYQHTQQAENVVDLFQDIMTCLTSIEGIATCFVGRRNSHGVLEIEAVEGQAGVAYLAAMHDGRIAPITIADAPDEREGPAAAAWQSGKIEVVDSYLLDPRVEQWRPVGAQLGFRSSVAVPFLDEAGQTFALLNMYSNWPGFFSGTRRLAFLENIQLTVSTAAMKYDRGRVIPRRTRLLYSHMINDKHVEMHYQPVIDLRSGQMLKAEALARLRDDDGGYVSPASFIPALNGQDLLNLFELGLEQVCGDLARWAAQGLSIPAAINLPPQGITDTRYHDALFRILERTGTAPHLIELEVLETQEATDTTYRDRFFQNLRQTGIGIVQDDLGAGHSSLLRMDSMPFDAVKIDQGLVLRSSQRDPVRALEFIYHLTHLAHALLVPVTVEGLEHEGLIEAAAVLGADRGQGYGIGRPMPASALIEWRATYRYRADLQTPRTALGVLAGYLLWSRQLKAVHHWPETVEAFIRSPNVVQHYIDQQNLQDSLLQDLLNSNHVFARQDPQGRQFQRTSREIAKILSQMSHEQQRTGN